MIADLVAQDAQDRDLLIVVVKGMPLDPEVLTEYFELIERECPSIPFAMIADPNAIYVRKQGYEPRADTYRKLDPGPIFLHYDPDSGNKRILRNYRLGLIQSWIEDMIYHWKSEVPPESDQLAAIGLLDRLKKGATYREVGLGADALR
jgi:hypothetical protein